METNGDNASSLSKKGKGRWKKLRKRAIRNDDGSGGSTNYSTNSFSGLIIQENWIALQEYHKKATAREDERVYSFGPSVCLRKNNQISDQAAEGVDHRDILANLLLQRGQTSHKKRARDDDDNVTADSFSIPAWATLHNPACLEHVAVIQIHLEHKAATLEWERVFQDLTVLEQTDSKHSIIKTQTRWFQGPSPKSITDSLLYLLRDRKNKAMSPPKEVTSIEQLIYLLEDLVLSHEEQVAEGYPLIDTSTGETPLGCADALITPAVLNESFQLLSLEEAKAMVGQYKLDSVINVAGDDGIAKFVMTQSHHRNAESISAAATPRILALDCEMVRTTAGAELARITLVQLERWELEDDDDDDDDNGKLVTQVLLDEWVRPHRTVLDYLTEYSGATAKILDHTTTRLEQIQAALLQLVDSNDILIGHSLENDLRAARIVHHRVVDTAVLFRVARRGCKFSLKHLAVTLLKRRIQNGNHHCSEEDAVTAMHLSLQRARLGPSFGFGNRTAIPLLDAFTTRGVTLSVGPATWLEEHITRQPNSIHALACENVNDSNSKAVSAWLTGPKRRARLVLSNLGISEPNELNSLNKLLVSGCSACMVLIWSMNDSLTNANVFCMALG